MFDIELGSVRITGVRPGSVAGRGEGHVANADRVEGPQHAQRAAERVAALDARQRAQLVALVRLHDFCKAMANRGKQ